jgi:hypothetical protein
MRVVYKTPVLEQVRRLIKKNVDHDPEVSHIEMGQAEFAKLAGDLRGGIGDRPRDTDDYVIVDGVDIRRVR